MHAVPKTVNAKSSLCGNRRVGGGGGGGRRRGCVLKMKIQTCRGGGGGGMLPRENFRNFEMPWTTFHAFSWWRKRERQCRVATRFFL